MSEKDKAEKGSVENEKTYDNVFWTGVVRLKNCLVPLVNEAFGEHFTDNAEVTLIPNDELMPAGEGTEVKKATDARFHISEIIDEKVERTYNFECQAKDEDISIRLAEYALGSALQGIESGEGAVWYEIPYSAVIYLRSSKNTPEKIHVTGHTPGGTVEYDCPVLKMSDYTIDSLFDKKLLLLVPFYFFNFESDFRKMEKDPESMGPVREMFEKVNRRLGEMVESGEVNDYQRQKIYTLIQRVADKLTVMYKNVRKGVEEIMGGVLIRSEEDEIYENGIKKGIEQGEDTQAKKSAIEMKRDGLSEEKIAQYIGRDLQCVLSWLSVSPSKP